MTDIFQNEPATLGHNQPPEPTLIERCEQLVERTNQRIAEEIADDDTAGRAQGMYDQLRQARNDLEAAKKREREPFLDELERIATRYATPLGKITMAYSIIGEKLTAWNLKKQQRLREEKERERIEAAEKLAEAQRLAEIAQESGDPIGATVTAQQKLREAEQAARDANKPAPKAQVHGDYSKRALGLRTTWSARLVGSNDAELRASEAALLKAYAKDIEARPAMIEACMAVARRRAKLQKRADMAPAGVEFFSDQRV